MLDVSFNDEWAKKLEKKMEQTMPLILTKQACRPDCWLILLGNLSYILNVLNRKDDFTDRELDILQDDIDAWAENWIVVNGREGCTNYTQSSHSTISHFSGSGETYTGTQTKGKSIKIKEFGIGITIIP
jgi:hypothetical protein